MPNVRIFIAYDGADFHGWQRQEGLRTVQGELEQAVRRFLGDDEATVQGASRTDAGVHALGQCASFHHDAPRSLDNVFRGLNTLTPRDMAIVEADHVPHDFDARHSSTGKRYRYRIQRGRVADPLRRGQTWFVRADLDVAAMRAAAADLLGTHDFSSFRAADCQAVTTTRELTRVELAEEDDELVLWVEGTAFLKYMVRNIAGTLVDVGRGQIPADALASILAAHDRSAAGQTAPPHALTLMRVFYE